MHISGDNCHYCQSAYISSQLSILNGHNCKERLFSLACTLRTFSLNWLTCGSLTVIHSPCLYVFSPALSVSSVL